MKKSEKIIQLTSQCVMCGLCTPSCPTYQISQDENLSPRGRISLIQALAQNKINYSAKIKSHLDTCLQCMTCQAICPSQVKYDEIINYGQEVIFANKKQVPASLIALILSNGNIKSLFIKAVNFLYRTRLTKLIKLAGKKLNLKSLSILPDKIILQPSSQEGKSNPPSTNKSIIIFTGCANSIFDSELAQHSSEILQKLNIPNISIDSKNCCGAIYKKAGNSKSYNVSIKQLNQQYLPEQSLISLNSSCSASLIESKTVFDSHAESHFNTQDIIDFLANNYYQALKKMTWTACQSKVLLHQSCAMKNRLKTQHNCLKLLQLIPQIEIVSHTSSCCGASGDYMFTHTTLADKIATPIIDFIIKQKIHLMLSTDISCSLHIKQQLEKQNYHLEVIHPISLLYRQAPICLW